MQKKPAVIQIRTRAGEEDIEVGISQICFKDELGNSIAYRM